MGKKDAEMLATMSFFGQFTVLPALIALAVAEFAAFLFRSHTPAGRWRAWGAGLLAGALFIWVDTESWLLFGGIAVACAVALTLLLRLSAVGSTHLAVAMTLGATIAWAIYSHFNPGDNPSQGAVAYALVWLLIFLPGVIGGLIASFAAKLIRRPAGSTGRGIRARA
ncbi:hypothetical protein QVA66_06055 [Staphylococcus chromogenes]|nr:hypothetical protein [Staphylococcus chromogenes]